MAVNQFIATVAFSAILDFLHLIVFDSLFSISYTFTNTEIW